VTARSDPQSRVDWIVVAHGSRAGGTAADHEALCRDLAARAAGDVGAVHPAFLEISHPSVPEAIDDAVAGGARDIVVIPYFLHAGNHTQRDIPQLIDEARARHPGVSMELTGHLGPRERMVDILADLGRSTTRRRTS